MPENSPYRPLKFIGIAVLVVILAVIVSRGTGGGTDRIPWQTDFPAAQAESRQTGKPILLYFTASWCGPCQEMRQTTFSDVTVAAALQKYIPVKIDIDSNSALAQSYKIEAIPHFFLLDPGGQVQRSEEGGMATGQFLQWIGGSAN